LGHVAHAVHNGSVHALRFIGLGLAGHVHFGESLQGEEMTATTYESITESNGAAALKCLLCRGESSGADDVQRLYCTIAPGFTNPSTKPG
jgi:hypothetical protein